MGKTNLIKNILKDFHNKINFFELDFNELFVKNITYMNLKFIFQLIKLINII
jgi:hypothetical protein